MRKDKYKKLFWRFIGFSLFSALFIFVLHKVVEELNIYTFIVVIYFVGYGYATRMFHESIEEVFPPNDNPPNSGELE